MPRRSLQAEVSVRGQSTQTFASVRIWRSAPIGERCLFIARSRSTAQRLPHRRPGPVSPTGSYGNVCSRMPPPYPVVRARLDRAIASRDLVAVRSAARDLPGVVTLVDAVQVLDLMQAADDPGVRGCGCPLDRALRQRMRRRHARRGSRSSGGARRAPRVRRACLAHRAAEAARSGLAAADGRRRREDINAQRPGRSVRDAPVRRGLTSHRIWRVG